MRSALELDAEVRRLRRSMRRLVGFLTLALVVAVAAVVAVVGMNLTAADKEAFQAFDGGARKANAAKADIGKAKAEAAKANAEKDAHQTPARGTVGQAPAAPQQPARPPAATASAPPPPAPARTAAPSEPQPAPAREAVAQAPSAAPPAPATTAAPAQPAPAPQPTSGAVTSTTHPAVADQRRPAEPRKRHARQVAHARPTEDTESEADANPAANPADRPRQDTDSRARSRHRRYVRARPADQERMRLPDDGSDRMTVVTKRRPPAYAPFEQPYDRAPEVRRDRSWDGPFGLFGGLFGPR